jgi:hypothetical protein
VDVAESDTGGLGVFIAEGVSVEAGNIVSEYPGCPRWVSKDLFDKESHTTYVFAWGPVRIPGVGQHYITWSPNEREIRQEIIYKRCAHLINTAHPLLFAPFKVANCCYGLYFGDNFVLDIDVSPCVRLFVVALCDMDHNSYGIDTPNEILVDYHWQLLLEFGLFCLDLECTMCFLAWKDFWILWKRLQHP